jgi:GNAT superfamily N-acetyltransferase
MPTLDVRPAVHWPDVAAVMGARGGSVGCWCMFWRLTNQEMAGANDATNEAALRALVDGGRHPGLLLYAADEPVGWVSVGPRDEFHRIGRTKGLEFTDERDVWSLVCVYVAREHRGHGYTHELIDGAVQHAAAQGARIVESYPVADPEQGRKNGLSTGTVPMFQRAGFTVHRDPTAGRRLVMRRAARSLEA